MSRLALCLVLISALCLSACGQQEQGSTAKSHPHPQAGEESIEGFGAEASGSQRQAILAAEQGYLRAVSASDFKRSCALLGSRAHESLQQLVPKRFKDEDCAAILPKLLSPQAPATAKGQAGGEVAKVRVEGERAFVLFHAPGAKFYVFTMVREGGGWKAGEVGPSVLVPAQGTG